jgi:hypothetical protein
LHCLRGPGAAVKHSVPECCPAAPLWPVLLCSGICVPKPASSTPLCLLVGVAFADKPLTLADSLIHDL